MKSDMGHRKWLDEYPALKQVVEKPTVYSAARLF